MIKGAIVVNGYMRTAKFEEITGLYEEAAKTQGIELEVWYTDQLCYGFEGDHTPFINEEIKDKQFVLFLDKDVMLARQLERLGLRVFNSARAIEICDHKGMTIENLAYSGIKCPQTILAPLVFRGMYDETKKDSYMIHLEERLGYPMVVKECYGSFGMQVHLVHNRKELREIRGEIGDIPHLYQSFVRTSIGRDVRIHVVGGEVVASMLRCNQGDFRANITNGGTMHHYEPNEAFKEMAVQVCDKLGLDFAGVDLMFGEGDEPVLCEVNSNAHIKNILDLTGINIAEKIMAYIGKEVTKDEGIIDL